MPLVCAQGAPTHTHTHLCTVQVYNLYTFLQCFVHTNTHTSKRKHVPTRVQANHNWLFFSPHNWLADWLTHNWLFSRGPSPQPWPASLPPQYNFISKAHLLLQTSLSMFFTNVHVPPICLSPEEQEAVVRSLLDSPTPQSSKTAFRNTTGPKRFMNKILHKPTPVRLPIHNLRSTRSVTRSGTTYKPPQ